MKEKVLITGINGFTGVYLERYLAEQGFNVFGTVMDTPKTKNHFQCNITNKAEIENIISNIRPDYVVHIAAISFVGESNASLIYDVNVLGTENLLHALVENDVNPNKVILASSATVYGNQGKEVLDESMCPKPVNHYGCSKLAMEHVAKNYFNKFDIVIIRPFNYTGIGQEKHFLIPKIIDHYVKKAPFIELGNIHVAREFNDIDDVIEIYYRLLIKDVSSSTVNLSSNIPVKLLDVIEQMNTIAGYTMEVRVNPDFVRKNEIASLAGSTKKLQNVIGNIEHTPISKTLSTMYMHAIHENS